MTAVNIFQLITVTTEFCSKVNEMLQYIFQLFYRAITEVGAELMPADSSY